MKYWTCSLECLAILLLVFYFFLIKKLFYLAFLHPWIIVLQVAAFCMKITITFHRRTGRDRGRGAGQNLPWKFKLQVWMPGLKSCVRPPDFVVSRFFRWILSNSEDLFALKMHLICLEIQFFQTPGGGGGDRPSWPLHEIRLWNCWS